MRLNRDLREFVELLNSNGVEYLVVGGFAVAWHGHPRFTGDIDFFVRPAAANGEAIVAALRAFGFGGLDITANDFGRPNRVVQLGLPPNRIDLITSIAGVAFDGAREGRMAGEIDGLPVAFICLEELIRNQETAGGPKDPGDADALRRIRPGSGGAN
jgi:hypothetical protein